MRITHQPDVFAVAPRHAATHDRLTNWARWASGGSRTRSTSPMFRLLKYQSPRGRDPLPVNPLVNLRDAIIMEKHVAALPDKHRRVIVWWYITRSPGPAVMRQRLGVTLTGLCELCNDARQMLDNRLPDMV